MSNYVKIEKCLGILFNGKKGEIFPDGYTVRNLHFCPKIQIWFPVKIIDFFVWNTRENVVVLECLAVNNFDFTRKKKKKVLGEKLMKMLEFYQNWIYTVLGDLLCIVLKNLLGRRSSSASASMPHSGHDFLVSSQNTGSWQGRRFMWPVTNWPKQVPRQLGINLWHFPTDHEARLKTTKRRYCSWW